MFDSKKNIKWSEKDIWDTLYLLVFVICLCEIFLHSSYVPKTENWIGTVLAGSHKVWDRLIYSLTISVALLRFSMQTGVTRIQRIIVCLILFIFSFHYFATGLNIETLVFGCLCIGAYNFPFSRIIKFYLWENVILYLFVVVLALLGFIENRVYWERASLGFGHPNTMSAHVMAIIVAYFVWRQARITWAEIGIAAIVELIIFRVGVSRSSLIGTMLFLFLCICYKLFLYIKDKKAVKAVYNAITFLMCFSIFLFGGITVLLSYFYSENRGWMVKANQLFSTRLSLGRIGFDKYNASWLGKPVKMISEPKEGEQYFYLDSYYIRSIFEWGLLALAAFLLLYFLVSYRAKCLDNFLILSALSVFALHGMMEVYMASFVYNPYLLFLLASTGTEKLVQNKGERL